MSTEPTDRDEPGGVLVPFPVRPAPAVLDEDDDSAVLVDPPDQLVTLYATVLAGKTAARRPIVPAWARNRDELRDLVSWASRHYLHVAGYHVTRSPKYAAKLTWRAPVGAGRTVAKATRWVLDAEGAHLRLDAVAKTDTAGYMTLSRQRNERVKRRGMAIALAVVVAALGVGVLLGVAPGWAQLLVLLVGMGVLGVLGSPADARVLDVVTVSASAPPRLTADTVTRALGALGIAEIGKALAKGGGGIAFPAPITRDGPGWRADVDLPYGVTVSDVVERRDRLASGLRRPLGSVWPDAATEAHAGRLVLWVGDQPLSQTKPAPWPLRKAGTADIFSELPFGVDQRGRPVGLPLIESNMLIGSLPGAGKTASLRCVLLGCALDPTVEMHLFELKGSGDLESLERIAHAYGSGVDDDTIERCLHGLRWLLGELERRAGKLKALRSTSRDLVPDSKVTRDLANRRSLGLWPIVFVVDEAQELFSHGEYGKEAGDLATAIIKRGRALGVMLILATQRPDKDSLPTGVSANVGTRFCLRVMGQVENDMVLGTSSYRNGIRATLFTRSDRGIGYLVGATDAPVVVRAYYLDAEASDAVVARAHAARAAAGLLSGHAAGDTPPPAPIRDLLDDVRTVLATAGTERIWHDELVGLLIELRPDTYAGWDARRLGAELRAAGVPTRQIAVQVEGEERVNRNGVHCDDVDKALASRPDQPELT